ncbi:hypothetical protein PENSPDRAFT_685717 [Peniophora sp. CONT]|nr:hypothetical protein PENSPDRAFT_685717 [Peniophora sp. CONT]
MSGSAPAAGDVAHADIAQLVPLLLIIASLGSMLVPVMATLVAFTPRRTRRQPVFQLNVISCALGLLQAGATIGYIVQFLFDPTLVISRWWWMFKIITLLVPPMFFDTVLLFRTLAFFPVQLRTDKLLLCLLTVPVLIKTARVVVVLVFMVTYPMDRLSLPGIKAVQGLVWGEGPLVMSLFALQAIDNAYASLIFLYKLYDFRKDGEHILHDEVMTRLPAIFLIALGNCVFPVTMNIIQIGLMAAQPHWMEGIYIIYINNYVTILGTVFATVWTSRHNWATRTILDSPPDSSLPPAAEDVHTDKSVNGSSDDTLPCEEREASDGDRWSATR